MDATGKYESIDRQATSELKEELKSNSLDKVTVRYSKASGRVYIDIDGKNAGFVTII